MLHLTRNDYATVLALVAQLEQLAADPRSFLQLLLDLLPGLVASEQASLAWRDLSCEPARIPNARSRPGYVLTLPLGAEGHRLVRIELHRSQRDFSQRDRERLQLLQPHLAYLYRQCGASAVPPVAIGAPVPVGGAQDGDDRTGLLTPREVDVMRWLACGKTDADIAALLAISPRTVHKHLEHIYEKLGVETRTAAVMAMRRRSEQLNA